MKRLTKKVLSSTAALSFVLSSAIPAVGAENTEVQIPYTPIVSFEETEAYDFFTDLDIDTLTIFNEDEEYASEELVNKILELIDISDYESVVEYMFKYNIILETKEVVGHSLSRTNQTLNFERLSVHRPTCWQGFVAEVLVTMRGSMTYNTSTMTLTPIGRPTLATQFFMGSGWRPSRSNTTTSATQINNGRQVRWNASFQVFAYFDHDGYRLVGRNFNPLVTIQHTF